jgi:hypothetical protein
METNSLDRGSRDGDWMDHRHPDVDVGDHDDLEGGNSGDLGSADSDEQLGTFISRPESRRAIGSLPDCPDVIRWETPLAHKRRTPRRDTPLGGKLIRKGATLVMWYLPRNRDIEAIDHADRFIIDRAQPPRHTAFGFRSPLPRKPASLAAAKGAVAGVPATLPAH